MDINGTIDLKDGNNFYCMKQYQKDIIMVCIVITVIMLPQTVNGQILEDEFEICSFEEECFKLPADDIFDDETIEKIWMRFQFDLDTYPRN